MAAQSVSLGPTPLPSYHNALSAVHPSVAAGVGLDPKQSSEAPGQGPGYQVFKRRAVVRGWLSIPSNRAADGNWGRCQGIFFQAGVGWMGAVLKTVPPPVKGEPSG